MVTAERPFLRLSISYPVRTPLGESGGDQLMRIEVGVSERREGGSRPEGAVNKKRQRF